MYLFKENKNSYDIYMLSKITWNEMKLDIIFFIDKR